jgi:hypothetical protein
VGDLVRYTPYWRSEKFLSRNSKIDPYEIKSCFRVEKISLGSGKKDIGIS